jgi:hypothetical protein
MDSIIAERTVIRDQVCTACERRPAGSELLAVTEPRECEPRCDLFRYLPRIARLVRRFGSEPPCGYESAFRSLACSECVAPQPDCETLCPRPLTRYATEVAALIEMAVRQRGEQI